MGATCADSVLLTTSDIAGRSGALRSFYRGSLARLQEQSGPICLVAVGPTAPEEDSPIYVHYDYSGRVHAYGKGIEPSVRSFASARVLNGEFRDAYLKHWEPSLTDTQTMTKVLTSLPGSIVAVEVDAIFDVDEIQSLKRARALKAVDRLGHAARQDRWVRPDQLPEVGNRGRGEDA